MRILISSIHAPYFRGGGELLIEGLHKALLEHGHETEVIRFPFKFAPESYLQTLMDDCIHQDFRDFNGYRIDKVISLQFPAYYVQHPNKTVWLMHQHRAVYDLHSQMEHTPQLNALREKIVAYDNHYLGELKKIYTISQNVSRRLKKYNHIDSTPLYPPLGNEAHFYCEDDYGFIFYPSRLEKLKRQDLLIDAMQYTKTKVVAIIAGTGAEYDNYQKRIHTLDIADKVRLTGYISDEEKYALYARSLAVFFAPVDEDYGYISLEAMLACKPIITCCDSGGPTDFVKHEESGFVLDPDPRQIAEKIDYLYENRPVAARYGRNAREYYASLNISWEKVVKTLLSDNT